ncbi:MAG: hypothetical protein IPL53_20060 [Ignavibacteria bacterium]|nr:hypothetical protein [Ignavibacteria bacterium]
MPDTLEINVANNSPDEYIKLRISIYNRDNNSLLDEDEVQIQAPGTYDTTIYYPIPRYFQPKNNKIVVEAIPGSAL